MAENEYTDSTAKRDLDRRLNDDSPAPVFNESVNPTHEDENGFVGVDPVYANTAVDTDEPYPSEEGPEAKAEELFSDAVNGEPGEVSPDLEKAHAKVTREDVPGVTTTTPESTPAASTSEGDAQESKTEESGGTSNNSPSA